MKCQKINKTHQDSSSMLRGGSGTSFTTASPPSWVVRYISPKLAKKLYGFFAPGAEEV